MLESVAVVVFYVCILALLYTYALYPLLLLAVRSIAGRRYRMGEFGRGAEPKISVVFSVYNEEDHVLRRIENLLETSYPAGRLEILVGSDGSTDLTNRRLAAVSDPRVRVSIFDQRRGKAAVLNDLIRSATGEIIVFTDANTRFESWTIPGLVGPLADESIGGVCGELRLGEGARGADGEASYWTYESHLKGLESDMGTILGATGAVYAIRREYFVPLPTDSLVVDDFLIPLVILRRGSSVRYNPAAVAFEASAGSVAGEFRRKVRIGTANFFAIREFTDLLHPRRGFVAFALWSHKLVRWFAPVLMILAFLASVVLASLSPSYAWVLAAEGGFLLVAAAGFLGELAGVRTPVILLPYYFVAMNAALFVGMLKFLADARRPHWDVVR